jgi:hypothetical protein
VETEMTNRIETLRALQSRIRESKGADRELDAQIFRAFDGPLPEKFANLGITLEWQADGSATMPIGDMQVRYDPPPFRQRLSRVFRGHHLRKDRGARSTT